MVKIKGISDGMYSGGDCDDGDDGVEGEMTHQAFH